jgi:hypothetical protein
VGKNGEADREDETVSPACVCEVTAYNRAYAVTNPSSVLVGRCNSIRLT